MKLIRGMLTDLRERQILPAVVLLVLLAFAVPIGASIILSKVTTPPGTPVAPRQREDSGGAARRRRTELAVLNGTPRPSVTRHGTPVPTRSAARARPRAARARRARSDADHDADQADAAADGRAHDDDRARVTHTAVATHTETPHADHDRDAHEDRDARRRPTPRRRPRRTTRPRARAHDDAAGSGSPLTGPASLSADQAYTVTLDTKDAQGTHVLSDLVRLAPLPAAQSPEVIFLGVLKGGKKAVFLFTNPVQFTGPEHARPACPRPRTARSSSSVPARA